MTVAKSQGTARKSEGDGSARRRAIMIKLDPELRNELDVLAGERKKTVQQLGIEAICDLLRKHGRPVNLRDAFRQSAGVTARRPAVKGGSAGGSRKAGGRKK